MKDNDLDFVGKIIGYCLIVIMIIVIVGLIYQKIKHT